MSVELIRNMAIIAHTNHGKTMLRKVIMEGVTGKTTEIDKDKKQTKTNHVVSFTYKYGGGESNVKKQTNIQRKAR